VLAVFSANRWEAVEIAEGYAQALIEAHPAVVREEQLILAYAAAVYACFHHSNMIALRLTESVFDMAETEGEQGLTRSVAGRLAARLLMDIPHPYFERYLERMQHVLESTRDNAHERDQLIDAVFKSISDGLDVTRKPMGVHWWLKQRNALHL